MVMTDSGGGRPLVADDDGSAESTIIPKNLYTF